MDGKLDTVEDWKSIFKTPGLHLSLETETYMIENFKEDSLLNKESFVNMYKFAKSLDEIYMILDITIP